MGAEFSEKKHISLKYLLNNKFEMSIFSRLVRWRSSIGRAPHL
jgi:hypothetical protein